MLNNICENFDIKEFMLLNKLNQKQLAEYLDKSQSFISQVKNGIRQMPKDLIVKIKKEGIYVLPECVEPKTDRMKINQRLKDIISELKRLKFIRNQQEFVEIIGYNKSSVSQIVNGRTSISKQFVDIVCAKFPVNKAYILTGKGSMLKETANTKLDTDMLKDEIIALQKDTIEALKRENQLLREKLALDSNRQTG